MGTEFVRVKDPDTKHEVTVPASFAKAYKMEPLDKAAVDENGRPLPGKPHVELAKADDKSGDDAGSTPEGSAPSSSNQTPTTGTETASNAATANATGSGQTAGKAATK